MRRRSGLVTLLSILACGGLAAPAAAQPAAVYSAPAIPVGTPHAFQVATGQAFAPYVFDLSLAGTAPGTPLGPGTPVLPLNRPFVVLDLFGGAPPPGIFLGFAGLTDALGRAEPRLAPPPVATLAGLAFDSAAVAASASNPGTIGFVGNAAHAVLVGPGIVPPAGPLPPFRPAAPAGAATRFVSPAGNDANSGLTPATAWRQISHAATQVGPGDIVDIADGSYAGPVLIRYLHGSAAAPVVFRATGSAAILTGSANTNNDDRNSIFIGESSWIVIHGLRVFASLRAGVRVSVSPHVTIQSCVFGNHQKWGVFTDYADDLAVLGCECFGSIDEHGIYHSNSGDRAVLAGNWCHDNRASGIQINADPAFLTPYAGYVPDGLSHHGVVERNLCVNNGQSGGAAINLACVRSSVIRNNVIVNTVWQNSTGIALWDDANGPVWGSTGNLIEHNTVAYGTGVGRYAVSLLNGSTGNVLRDNVLRAGRRGAIAFTQDSLPGLWSDGNVLWSLDGWPIVVRDEAAYQTFTLPQWQALGFDAHSAHAAPVFAAPAASDWSLSPGSPGRDQGVWSALPADVQGSLRPAGAGVDSGAYER